MFNVSRFVLLRFGSLLATLAFQLFLNSPTLLAQQTAPLRDVCLDEWTRYDCGLVRLCVSPEVQSSYDLSEPIKQSGGACRQDDHIVPEAWTRATCNEVGWNAAGAPAVFRYYCRVAKLDSSMIRNGDIRAAVKELNLRGDSKENSDWDTGWRSYKPLVGRSAEAYGIPISTEKNSVDVCPAGWRRYSCQFVRLCVGPKVNAQDRDFIGCKADSHVVSKDQTNSSPHDVGFAAGGMILGPRYYKAVMLDVPDIINGDIKEAVIRLVYVPLPTNCLVDYSKGFEEGNAELDKYLQRAKAKESTTTSH